MNNWGLGMLDEAGEPWFIRRGEIEATPLRPDRPINETPVALTTDFLVGHKRYRVTVTYSPRIGIGEITLDVEPT